MPRLGPLHTESDELLHLDVLRFLAASGIVIYHFGNWSALHSNPLNLSVMVDLFFFISGFVITRFYGNLQGGSAYLDFMWKRFARLYPLHLVTALFFASIAFAFSLQLINLRLPGQLALSCLPVNLLLLHAAGTCNALSMNPVSWSISAEMMLYGAFPLLLLLRSLNRNATLVATLVIVAVLSIAVGPASDHPWYDWTFDGGIVRAVPSFLLGMACFDARETLARLPHAQRTLGLLCLTFAVLLLAGASKVVLIPTLYAIGAAAIAADQQRRVSAIVSAVAPLGSLTYSLYMLHPIVEITGISLVGKKLLHLEGAAMNGWIAVCFFASLALAWLSLQLFETPARLWLTRSRNPLPKPA